MYRIFNVPCHIPLVQISSLNTALVDATKSDWASTRTQPNTNVPEVVIITVSKRKLITPENTDPRQSNATNIQEVVVANPSESTTTSTQPQTETRSNMVEEGIRGLSPSSSEITLPAEPPTSQPHHPKATLNHVKPHHKLC